MVRQEQLYSSTERLPSCKHKKETGNKESTVKIFEQSIQTPCGLQGEQTAREQLLRMGDEEMAKTPRQFTGFLSWPANVALIY